MKASSALMLVAVLATGRCWGSEQEAREVFATGARAALTFSSDRAADDISLGFMHYTRAGRGSLLAELERTGVLAEVVNNRQVALRAEFPAGNVVVTKRVGANGLDEYDVRGDVQLQWMKCDQGGCTNNGGPKKVLASGVVVPVNAAGRPALRINALTLTEARK